MIIFSLEELKIIAKLRKVKDYKYKSKDELTKILSEPEPKINIEKIRKKCNESRDTFSTSKVKKSRRNLYEIVNKNNLSTPKIKNTEKNLFELEKNLSKLNKYYDYDDIEYKGIRDVGNLFDLSIDEDYYKPIVTNDAFNRNYIEYESKGDKEKNLSIEEYLNMTRPYLSDKINDHKTQGEWKVHSGNTVIDYKIQGEWKIQLTIAINFISSKDSDETPIKHSESNNIGIMVGKQADEIIRELFESLLQIYHKNEKK